MARSKDRPVRSDDDTRMLDSIAHRILRAFENPAVASRKLATHIGVLRPSWAELADRGVSEEAARQIFSTLRQRGLLPRVPVHYHAYQRSRAELMKELTQLHDGSHQSRRRQHGRKQHSPRRVPRRAPMRTATQRA